MNLLPFLLLGFAGALHCAGMCGGFAVAVAGGAGRRPSRLCGHLGLYVLGKASTYAVLGAAAARAGDVLAGEGALPEARSALAWAAAFVMAWLGLIHLGVRMPGVPTGAVARFVAPARRALSAARAAGGWAAALGTGLLTGLLPCGLTAAALLVATGTDPLSGAAGLFAFGLATSPALVVAGVGFGSLSDAWRSRLRPVVGASLLVFAVATAARGTRPSDDAAWAKPFQPECCEQPTP